LILYFLGLFCLFLCGVLLVISGWKVFEKAGQPGWAALVPIYQYWILVKIVGKPPLWFGLLFIPCVNFVILILLFVALATVFRKSVGFGVGLVLVPFFFFPMLAFGDATYEAPPPPTEKRPARARSRDRDDEDGDEDDRPRRNTRRQREEADED
jgi:hypothetical protein